MFARFESQSLLHYLKICLVAVLVTSSVSVKSQGMTVGNIYTIAGLGPNNAGYSGDGGAATSAELDRPSGVALDSAGNLYIADYYENRVRKITPAGVISTFAGNGTYGHNGDGDAATSAELAYPAAIAVDTTGNVYFTEIGNADVREVTTNGLIQTIAGTGAQNYNGDGIPATTADL